MSNSKLSTNLRQMAEASASSLTGDTADRNEAIAMQGHTSNMSGGKTGGGVTYNPSRRKLSITITNNTLNDHVIPLLDANGRFPLPNDVSISYDGFTQQEVKNMLLTKPFAISGIRYRYGDEDQLEYQFKIDEKVGEETRTRTYDPSLHEDPSAEKAIIEDPNFFLLAHDGTALLVPIAPSPSRQEGDALVVDKPRKIKLTFNVATSVDSANALLGKSPIEKHGAGFGRDNDVKIFG